MLMIEQPIITEKSMALTDKGTYTFAVNKDATKGSVAAAIAQLYGVTVTKVQIQSVTGQTIRRRTGVGRERDWKKAIVTLKAGQKIKAFALKEEKPAGKDDKQTKEKR